MPMPLVDLTGKRFGRLLVIKHLGYGNYRCKCDCGSIKKINGGDLKSGRTNSCKCLQSELRDATFITHGASKTAEYRLWIGMKKRCFYLKDKSYRHYGGRGITVCDKWKNDFVSFFVNMGPRPTTLHTIERIDNNGNYEPSNCKWATRKEQANNTRRQGK